MTQLQSEFSRPEPERANQRERQPMCCFRLVLEKSAAYKAVSKRLNISSPEAAYHYLCKAVEPELLPSEKFFVLALSSQNQIIGFAELFSGGISSTVASPREILQFALLCNASNIIISHNHPSGDPAPSEQDITATTSVKKACKLFDIGLLDHVILGDGSRYSFAEHGTL